MVTSWLILQSWLYNSTIIIRRSTHCTCIHCVYQYIQAGWHNTEDNRRVYQQCWHSIIGERLSIIHQCLVHRILVLDEANVSHHAFRVL